MARAVGIDLGTTNSVVAVLEGGEAVVVPNAEGARTTPVGGRILEGRGDPRRRGGQAAGHHQPGPHDPLGQARDGHVLDRRDRRQELDPAGDLRPDPAEAEARRRGVPGRHRRPRPSSRFPRTSTTPSARPPRRPGQIAGLEVLRIINEPTAAALAHGLDKEGADKTILVFDLGGGTFDVSLLEIGETEGTAIFEVKSTAGDTHLGGDDWDERVIDWMVTQFKNAHGVDLSKDRMAKQRLKEAAEKAKIELSQVQETHINLPFLSAHARGAAPLRGEAHPRRVRADDRGPPGAVRRPVPAGGQGLGQGRRRDRPRRARRAAPPGCR